MGLIGSTSGPGATVTGEREGKEMKKNIAICRSVRRKGKRKEGKVREKEENDRAYHNNVGLRTKSLELSLSIIHKKL
jgi:hypothetical protein